MTRTDERGNWTSEDTARHRVALFGPWHCCHMSKTLHRSCTLIVVAFSFDPRSKSRFEICSTIKFLWPGSARCSGIGNLEVARHSLLVHLRASARNTRTETQYTKEAETRKRAAPPKRVLPRLNKSPTPVIQYKRRETKTLTTQPRTASRRSNKISRGNARSRNRDMNKGNAVVWLALGFWRWREAKLGGAAKRNNNEKSKKNRS